MEKTGHYWHGIISTDFLPDAILRWHRHTSKMISTNLVTTTYAKYMNKNFFLIRKPLIRSQPLWMYWTWHITRRNGDPIISIRIWIRMVLYVIRRNAGEVWCANWIQVTLKLQISSMFHSGYSILSSIQKMVHLLKIRLLPPAEVTFISISEKYPKIYWKTARNSLKMVCPLMEIWQKPKKPSGDVSPGTVA